MQRWYRFCAVAFSTVPALILAGCGSGKSTTTTPPPPATFQLTVTAPATGGAVTSNAGGISCPGTCSANFTANTQITLTATPGTGYVFGGWSGIANCSGTGPCTVTITSAESVTAIFNADNGLTLTPSGTGSGTVMSNPTGINCSPATPNGCTYSFAPNTMVSLSETPGANSTFAGWGGACTGIAATCNVTVATATGVTAIFNTTVAPPVALTVALAGTGTGTVVSNVGGVNCPTVCTTSLAPGTSVTLTETPGANSSFTRWSGCTGTTSCTFVLTTAQTVTATFGPANAFSALNHIILFADENRSFDHYFGFMRQYWANTGTPDQSFDGLPQFTPPSQCTIVNGVSSCAVPSIPGCNLTNNVTSCSPDTTNQITSFSFHSLVLPNGVGTVCEENQSPFWNEAHNDWDYTNAADQPVEADAQGNPNPPLNGFVFTAAYDARSNALMDVNGVRAMGYYEDADLNFYYALATDFGTSDRWFSPVMDRTQINRAYIYAATSQGFAYPPGGGNLSFDNHSFTAKTIFEALQDAGISWKIYVDPKNVTYTNPATKVTEVCSTEPAGQAQDLCLAGASYMNQFVYENQVQTASTGLWQHFAPISQFAIDLQDDATFPQFAMIEPPSSAGDDEHPSDTDISPVNVQLGAQYTENTVVKPFMQSPTWQDSALIFTYDEAGGLYDHVSPQPVPAPGDPPVDYSYPMDLVAGQNGGAGDICTNPGQVLGQGTCSFGWTGYRVPLVVISPYSKQNFVSHTVRDTTAVLAMVETRFGLSPLTNRDAYYLPGTTTDYSMDEFFDFVNKPWATPPTFVPQTTGERCDQTPALTWNEPPEVTVTITGGGSVSSSPAFVQGFEPCTTECTVPVAAATIVTLTATPNTGSTFTGWTGGGCSGTTPTCSVTAAGQQFVTATFNP